MVIMYTKQDTKKEENYWPGSRNYSYQQTKTISKNRN